MCVLFFYEFLQSKSTFKISQDETNLFQIYWICCFWYLEINIKKSSSEMMILKWCWIILSPWNCNPSWFGACFHPHLVTIRTARDLKLNLKGWTLLKGKSSEPNLYFGLQDVIFQGCINLFEISIPNIRNLNKTSPNMQVPPPAQAARRAWHVAALGFPSKTPCRFASAPD